MTSAETRRSTRSTEDGRARWHFSFDQYRDPENDRFGAMRVFNDDRLVPGAIWPMHPHRDIEGLTYVVEGMFGHEDDVGGDYGPLPAGSVQRMTLGRGANHSEQNASESLPMRFIQIWILPDTAGLEPGVEQAVLDENDRANNLLKAIGPSGAPVSLHQDASVYISRLDPGVEVAHEIGADRGVYVYLIEGDATIDDEDVSTGDAAKVTDRQRLKVTAKNTSELIVVDVPLRFEAVGIWRGRM